MANKSGTTLLGEILNDLFQPKGSNSETDRKIRLANAAPGLLAACEKMLDAFKYIPIPKDEEGEKALWAARDAITEAILETRAV